MANFNVSGFTSVTTTAYKTSVYMAPGATPRRIKLYDMLVGTYVGPADHAVQYDVSRTTARAASAADTLFTPVAIDVADAAALFVATVNATTEPTTTALSSLWNVGVNSRASYRWVAVPGGELVTPATQSSGLTGRMQSTGHVGLTTFDVMVQEQ